MKSESATMDKYIGDAIMAFWNAPEDVPDHPYLACRAALRCQKRLSALREKWKAEGLPPFQCRIGINTGTADVGIMGSAIRLSYTVIGDAVNLASRLEGMCKYYGVEIIIGHDTYEKVKDRVEVRRLDLVAAKGKTDCIYIYELFGLKGEVAGDVLEFAGKYEQAYDLYTDRRFREAGDLFRQAQTLAPNGDIASELMAARCRAYLESPPPADWDGSCALTVK